MTNVIKSYENRIKDILFSDIGDRKIAIIHFGSRARGQESPTSDYDIALDEGKPIDYRLMRKIKEHLEKSTIPYKVDLVDFSVIGDDFKKQIERDGIFWKRRI
jgi:predicted nucleotidyltransferase